MSKLTAHAQRAEQDQPATIAILRDANGKDVLRAYSNADGSVIRIVLPELGRAEQCTGHVESVVPYLEFRRSA